MTDPATRFRNARAQWAWTLTAPAMWQLRIRRVLDYLARRDRNGVIPRFESWLVARGILQWRTAEHLDLLLREVRERAPRIPSGFLVAPDVAARLEEAATFRKTEPLPFGFPFSLGLPVTVDPRLPAGAALKVYGRTSVPYIPYGFPPIPTSD